MNDLDCGPYQMRASTRRGATYLLDAPAQPQASFTKTPLSDANAHRTRTLASQKKDLRSKN